MQSLAKLVTNLPIEPFTKWGSDLLEPIKTNNQLTRN
jgi:hypothetical protein